MKKVIEVQEVPNEGLAAFLGHSVTLLCENYFYTGTLTGINDVCVLLESPTIVYETGAWVDKAYKTHEKLPSALYVMIHKIEAFGVLKGGQ